MTACASAGALSRFAINTDPAGILDVNDFSTGGGRRRFDILSEGVIKSQTLMNTSGLRGTRSNSANRARLGTYSVGGTIMVNPSPNMLDVLLPIILGAAESSDIFAVAEALSVFGIMVDRVGQVHRYSDCKVSRAVFRGSEGSLLELELDVMGKAEVVGETFPVDITLGNAAADQPYTFMDSASGYIINSVTYPINSFELTIDNLLEARFRNSVTATCITAQDRIVSLRTNHPWTTTEAAALYNGTMFPGLAGSLTFTNGGTSLKFDFPNLQSSDQSPSVQGKTEVTYDLDMLALETAATKEIVVTSDSVP